MKKVGIVTIIDNDNYGNRLQNYALSRYCNNNFKVETITLLNESYSNDKRFFIIRSMKNFIFGKKYKTIKSQNRKYNFELFNNFIKYSTKKYTCFSNLNKYDFLIVGSDQVWNPNFRRLRDFDLLKNYKKKNKISYAASFGISELEQKKLKKLKKSIDTFKSISVREETGKEIIQKISLRKDIQVLIDPTMLLSAKEWDKVSKRPEQINLLNGKKYILNYFLGNLSEQRKTEIERIAKENDCEIINILDEKDPFFVSGPSEFLYLEKNAFLICTDSFHSSVFAILYNRPFVIFDREQEGVKKMNSRIDTLISKFNLKNRKYNGSKITKENLEHDYTEAYKILEEERKKSDAFLKKALDIKESE